jgi:hypothetical protein
MFLCFSSSARSSRRQPLDGLCGWSIPDRTDRSVSFPWTLSFFLSLSLSLNSDSIMYLYSFLLWKCYRNSEVSSKKMVIKKIVAYHGMRESYFRDEGSFQSHFPISISNRFQRYSLMLYQFYLLNSSRFFTTSNRPKTLPLAFPPKNENEIFNGLPSIVWTKSTETLAHDHCRQSQLSLKNKRD